MSAPFNDRGPFAVGEVCRAVNAEFHLSCNGQFCEVIETGIRANHPVTYAPFVGYLVKFNDGAVLIAEEHQLRRRRPPATDANERTFMAEIRKLADKAPQRQGEAA